MFVQVILNDVYVCVCARAQVYMNAICVTVSLRILDREREGEKN